MLQQPLRVTVGVRNSAATTVKQRLLFVGREAGKLLALRQLLREGLKPPVLVFVASKVCAMASLLASTALLLSTQRLVLILFLIISVHGLVSR